MLYPPLSGGTPSLAVLGGSSGRPPSRAAPPGPAAAASGQPPRGLQPGHLLQGQTLLCPLLLPFGWGRTTWRPQRVLSDIPKYFFPFLRVTGIPNHQIIIMTCTFSGFQPQSLLPAPFGFSSHFVLADTEDIIFLSQVFCIHFYIKHFFR